MHKIDTSGSVDGSFIAGNPTTNTPPTTVGADWLNAVNEELNNFVIASGQTPNKADNTQMIRAFALVMNLAGDGCGVIGGNAFGTSPDCTTAPAPKPVADSSAPVITINGNNPVNLVVGDAYVDAGASATDNNNDDGVVTVTSTGAVDTTTAGTYTITYTATDAAANVGTKIRTINVADTAENPPINGDDLTQQQSDDIFNPN